MKRTIVGIFLSGLLILAGCSGITTAPDNGASPQDGPEGNLTVRIGYSISTSRTAYPSHDGTTPLEYKLEFAWTGGGTTPPIHDPVSVSPGVPASIRLETGSWTITAKALTGAVEKASGTASVTVLENGNAPVAITLSPVGDPVPTTGTLGYVLYFPVGTTGRLSLVDADGNPAGSPVISFSSGTEGAITLSPGSYLATVSLTNGTATAGRTEAVHIVAGLATKVAYNFYDDLVAPTPVTSDTDLAKIGGDSAWPLSGRYVLANDITLADWEPLGSVTNPFTGSFDGGGNTITINSFATTALENNQYIGIFAAVKGLPEHKARVKNLVIASSVSIAALSTTLGQGIGLVSGYTENVVISGVNLSGSLSIGEVAKIIFAGGAVGDMQKGTELKNCTSAMELSVTSTAASLANPPYTGATTAIGGLVGFFLTSANGSEYGEGKDVLVKDCANAGNVTANYVATGSTGTVAVGGIAGGWGAGAAFYLGRIEDCVYTGSITGSSIAGGIAGAIGGNGGAATNDANTSRILRCRTPETTGKIKGGDAGGIVGSVSNGALVARCSSNAVIEGTGSTSRVGGIASSLTTAARISDCWSGGTVNGVSFAGGIASFVSGNVTGTIERCYSKAAVNATTSANTCGVGGIGAAGVPLTNITVQRCVALNDGIAAPAMLAARVKRILGANQTNANATKVSMNYAAAIPVIAAAAWTHHATHDGTTLDEDPPGQWLYEGTLGWDFDEVWSMSDVDGCPKLRGVDEGY